MILIVARNNLHLTKRAVATALDQIGVPTREVLVIDNASIDGTGPWLRSKFGIDFISFTASQSLAACWNLGLDYLWSRNSWPVLVINNDVELREDTYSTLWATKEQFITGVSVRSKSEMTRKGTSVSPHPDFSCFMITQETFRRVGPFDESYKCYCEDSDYHVRLHRAGIKALSMDLPFLHHGAQTLKNADPSEASLIRRNADAGRARFKATYGCGIGTPEYDGLFLPANTDHALKSRG